MEINLDAATGEITTRELTDAEKAELEQTKAEFEQKQAEKANKAAARAALFLRLGITEEEAKLLLG